MTYVNMSVVFLLCHLFSCTQARSKLNMYLNYLNYTFVSAERKSNGWRADYHS